MNDYSSRVDLSAKASRGTIGGIAYALGWIALAVLTLATAAHAVSITMAYTNLNPTGGNVVAILALVGVTLVEVFAVVIAVMHATHLLRAKQKPVALTVEVTWFIFAAVNLISSFSMKHGGEMPMFVTYWIAYGLPIAGLIVGGLFYVVMRLNPDAARADDVAELRETFATYEHDATVEVLNSEQMQVVLRQAAWQKLPTIIGRQLNLSDAQIRNLEMHAPALIDNGRTRAHSDDDATAGQADMDLEELVSYLVAERLRNQASAHSFDSHNTATEEQRAAKH